LLLLLLLLPPQQGMVAERPAGPFAAWVQNKLNQFPSVVQTLVLHK